MKAFLKKIVSPHTVNKLRSWWHGTRALFTAFSLFLPATKMKIIGITGTKGKTTTTVFVGRLLNAIGIKTGYISTALLYFGAGEEIQNTHKMTTIDPVLLQRHLKTMQYAGCKVVVLEMSSQGLESNRHLGIFGFDYGVFLNLYPEHLDAHGSLENYVSAKGLLFESLRQNATVFVNSESEHAQTLLGKVPESVQKNGKKIEISPSQDIHTVLGADKYSLTLQYKNQHYPTQYFSRIEVEDFFWAATIASEVAQDLGSKTALVDILSKSSEAGSVPGRMEFAAHSQFADALVDYAHEPESMKQLLLMIEEWKKRGLYKHCVHILSCDGAGRDDWKKTELGKLSYQYADYSYLTTDNFDSDDDPNAIVALLAQDLPADTEDKKYFRVVDRETAMKQAFSKAKLLEGRTLLVSTGVGNEFGLTQPEGKKEWNEVEVWKKVFRSLGKER